MINHTRECFRGYVVRLHDYATAKDRYNNTLPLFGARRRLNSEVRPMTDRYRLNEVWFKENEDYGIAIGWSYAHWSPNPLPSNATAQQEKNHRFHVITGYTDNYYKLLMFKPDGELEFTPNSYLSNYVVWDVLGATLPKNVEFVRYGSKRYIKLNCPSGETMHYRVWEGVTMNFIPYEKDGVRYYALKNPIGEKKYLVDRSKAKREEVKRELDAFTNYTKVMMPMLSFDDMSNKYVFGEWVQYAWRRDKLAWLMRKDGEEIGEYWVKAIECICYLLRRYNYNNVGGKAGTYEYPSIELVNRYVSERAYDFARAFKEVQVPIGTPFYKNGREGDLD
jgi:hypothetical protein